MVDHNTHLQNYHSAVANHRTISASKFKAWFDKQDFKPIEEHQGYKVGQKILFNNGYGIPMVYKILAVVEPDKYGNCFFLDWDCYWAPIGVERIIKSLPDNL